MYRIQKLFRILPCRHIIAAIFFCFISIAVFAQPPSNDNCETPSVINITGGGFDIGIFNSEIKDLTAATVQTGENFAPAMLGSGQNMKSIWYKFTLPTTRAVRVTLAQPVSVITGGDAGFTVYKTNGCFPDTHHISGKLTPLGVFGNSYNPCVDSAVYYVQVSSKLSANGEVYIIVETAFPVALYDRPAQAYDFGTLAHGIKAIEYEVACQSTEDANETCNALQNPAAYIKSTWHVFTTGNYFDYIALLLSREDWVNENVKFGFKIYKGDVRVTPYSSLPVTHGCDSLQMTYTYLGRKIFGCDELETNTTYSIQIFAHKDFSDYIRVALNSVGTNPTRAPEPTIAAIPAPTNALGVLPSNANGITTSVSDYHGCNSRHSQHTCPPSMPVNGVYSGLNAWPYNLSSFFTFTLSTSTELTIVCNDGNGCSQELFMRLYKQDVTNSCPTLDPANIVGLYYYGWQHTIKCLEPGNYTLQVMGTDTIKFSPFNHSYGSLYNAPGSPIYFLGNLGKKFDLNITAKTLPLQSRYSLQAPGAFDSINVVSGVMQPLADAVWYNSHIDTFSCRNTVLPWDTACFPSNTKATYREFIVNDSTTLALSGSANHWKLYKSDADALANAQNVHAFPQRIQGMEPYTRCLSGYECNYTRVCLQPGTYTHVSFGSDANISQTNQVSVLVNNFNSLYGNPSAPEDLGDILATVSPGAEKISNYDYFSCKNNAVTINGYQPYQFNTNPATKAIYRQFYLSQPASIDISGYLGYNFCGNGTFYGPAYMTLFAGKASDGLAGLTVMPAMWQGFKSVSTANTCNVLAAGWYTIVSYGIGPDYANPMSNNFISGGYGSSVAAPDRVVIKVNPMCPGPKYNRPHKAAIDTATAQPFLIEWAPRAAHTNAYPKYDTAYAFPREYFNCTLDTPFASHPIASCSPALNRVAYYVFRTTQESYVMIYTAGLWGAVYSGNARTDSSLFSSSTLIQPCIASHGYIQLCKLQPGVYTLVVFAGDAQNCSSVVPSIYIDKTGYSRFDYANNAYDFGQVAPDSVWHDRKPGDVNPIDPLRRPSSDIVYCTTGAFPTDPADMTCFNMYNPNIYNGSLYLFDANRPQQVAKRNLWYTFVVKEGGNVRVQVNGTTPGKEYQPRFSVYRSNVDGTIPFSTVVSTGQVDSTIAQGLTHIGTNGQYNSSYCFGNGNPVSFYRDPCSPVTERYYVVVENPSIYNGAYSDLQPNSQFDVFVLVDSVNAIQPKFDHYYQANNIGTNLGTGTYAGETDNFSCATRDATDPGYACNGKTLWYKFSTTVTGHIRFRPIFNNNLASSYYTQDYIGLFRQVIPGDSTATGLQQVYTPGSYYYNSSNNTYWAYQCISPGTYYIMLPGCYQSNEYVYPLIEIVEETGDFCTRPVVATLNGPGSNVTPVLVDCHTIGTDFGEFNPSLTCPSGAITNSYKTSWFRIDITGTDTLDVTTYLTESTNASTTQIKYRMMDGDCSAMQARSCVQDALTQDTYECLPPGSYWIQVFSPSWASGTISLNLSAVHHVDTCAPVNNCLTNAHFQKLFDCTTSEDVRFVNYSTFGAAVNYQWDFGYNGQTSTSVSPTFNYPALTTSQTYHITLTVNNNSCGGQSVYTDSITIPPRPVVDLGPDVSLCDGGTVLLNATSHPGSTYYWHYNGSTGPTYTATLSGRRDYWVTVTYNGCISRDTINVNIDPINPVVFNKYLCGGDPATLSSYRGLGESYTWSTGSHASSINVFTPGVYWNDVTLNGCTNRDTFIVSNAVHALGIDRQVCFNGQPVQLNATTTGAISYTWQNGTTGATFNAMAPGLYWVAVSFGSCTLRDSIILSDLQPVLTNISARICAGQSYLLPSGNVVNTPGIYRDTVRTLRGCDSLINTVALAVETPVTTNVNANICPGQTYTLPWGTVVNTTGIYRDTLRSVMGCDSLRRTVNLLVETPVTQLFNPVICEGQTYTLPWGVVVNTAGLYRDTLHSLAGCDSIRREVNLTYQVATQQTFNPVICEGQSYTLPWGTVVSAPGNYRDTLHTAFGCDSIRREVNLVVQMSSQQIFNPVICAGQTYTLPWGAMVNTGGIYRDTLHYFTGCDSVRRTVNLIVQNSATQITSPVICEGQTYTLPWGVVVNAAGVYRDTLHYTTGCDSLRREVNLTYLLATQQTFNPVICAGQTYTLPWGTVVNATGIYRDTLHYPAGCDSIRRTVNLIVQAAAVQAANPVICENGSYTLPWGVVVSAPGIYRDTLHYLTGCDSVRRTVNLTVQTSALQTFNPIICENQSYTLPWGAVVNTPGIYRDTLYYLTGCDSVRRTVNLTVQTLALQTLNPVICENESYTLPWGTVVNASGIYRDTLHYATGCDSIRRTVNLIVQASAAQFTNAVICAGQTYSLPWGPVVNTAGTYRDTLHYLTGCDSIVRIVNVVIQNFTTQTTNPVICAGSSYTLPWGMVVNATGVYRDTLHYTTGCDSIRRAVNLTVQDAISTTANAVICQGDSYALPWGTVVNATGVYRDTLHYLTGCDSIRRTVNLIVQAPSPQTTNAVICQGGNYVLPWGAVVNTAGVYRDTLHYLTGCDSVRRTVNLQVTAAAVSTASATICSDETYTMPWGMVTNIAGIYKDTIRTSFGCDSLIQTVNLIVNPAPSVSLTKSNDVDCMLGIAKLEASGGVNYAWTPAGSLNNAAVYNPVASPSATTWYKVLVTSDKGCTTEDSIQVKVIVGTIENGYLVPNAFTPNGDGRNDCFGVQTWGAVTNFELSVFNRWGERVFYSNDPRRCWDGTYKGKEQDPNVFVYQIRAKGLCGDIYRKGTFVLIR